LRSRNSGVSSCFSLGRVGSFTIGTKLIVSPTADVARHKDTNEVLAIANQETDDLWPSGFSKKFL